MSIFERIAWKWFGPVRCDRKWRKRCEAALNDAARITGLRLKKHRVDFRTRKADWYEQSKALGVEVGVWQNNALNTPTCAVANKYTIIAAVNRAGLVPHQYLVHEMAHVLQYDNGLPVDHDPRWRGHILGW